MTLSWTNFPPSPQSLLLHWKMWWWDWGDPPSFPSTGRGRPQSRSTAPHPHRKQYWWSTVSPSWYAGRFARIPSRFLSSGISQAHMAWQDSFYSLTASLTLSIHHRVRGFLPRQAPVTLRPQLRGAASTMEVENMVHSDSMSPAYLGTWETWKKKWGPPDVPNKHIL